ncbi:hypothetical protein M3610_12365 [Neobacillus sp. MER 74]|uniref:hypothetical protein n=1 Tax=Bacillaceae TaxID=186817 RepID=UPI000A7E9A19|nr:MULTISPECIES: hypothetical protein [Bacillaceae]MCM3116089.1 hypothetical protein [Neobacillus sp. MER 74]PFP30887.1 hypothetical protein COJ96_02690 [Bacillus sp. AFS073361]
MNELNRKVKSVPFNLDDPYERELLEHCNQYIQFATYIKRLIQRDMEQGVGIIRKEHEKGMKQEKPIDKSKLKSFGL